MAEKKNPLQSRIGGSMASMNASELITQARTALSRLEPRVLSALNDQREQLRLLLSAPTLDVDALFALAHDARGLAGTFGYTHLGVVADALSRYIDACRDADAPLSPEVVRVLGQAMDQGFVKDEQGGDLLANLASGALALARAKSPKAA
jgi:chemotaxis protein histidine kinase CheA